jgi:hypothetical protein
MVNSQWSMDDGQWLMVNGRWLIVNGQWTMVNENISVNLLKKIVIYGNFNRTS